MNRSHVISVLSFILAALAVVFVAGCSRPGRIVWQHRYDSVAEGMGSSVATDAKDIIVGGTVRDSSGAAATAIGLARYDRDGNLKWQRTYSRGKRDSLSAVVVGIDHDILAVGSRTSAAAPDSVRLLLAEFSSLGNLKWDREFVLGHAAKGTRAGVDSLGRITVCGSADGNIFLAQFDSTGNMLDCETLDQAVDENGPDMTMVYLHRGVTIAAYTLVAGARRPTPGNSDSLASRGIAVIRLDPERKIVGRWVYDSSGNEQSVRVAGLTIHPPVRKGSTYDQIRADVTWSPHIFVAATSKRDSGVSTRVMQFDGNWVSQGTPNANCRAIVADNGGGVLGVGSAGPSGNQRCLGWRFFRGKFSEFWPDKDSLNGTDSRLNDIALDAEGNAVMVGVTSHGNRTGLLLTKYTPPRYTPPPTLPWGTGGGPN